MSKFCNSRAIQSTSGGWVIDWANEKCNQDCEVGPYCARHDEPSEQIFHTAEQCCQRLNWVPRHTCLARSQNEQPPTQPEEPVCTPKTIPNKCEIEILIDELELAFRSQLRLAAQSIRAAFHDAGTFNVGTGKGGANGCLLNDPDMRNEPENDGFDLPLNNLEVRYHGKPCRL